MSVKDERETTIATSDGDPWVRITTAQRTVITKMRKAPRFTEGKTWTFGSVEWVEFTIPADRWSPVTGAKRRHVPMSDEQRAKVADRFAAARQAKAVAA